VLYTEFPMPIPIPNTLRLGAQPFGTVATDKLALYANGDFPGVVVNLEFAPGATLNLAYVQVEEQLTGFKDGWIRGEDWAVIASFGSRPSRASTSSPCIRFFQLRRDVRKRPPGRGGVDVGAAFTGSATTVPPQVAGAAGRGVIEDRHTIGVDGKFTRGRSRCSRPPLSVWPAAQHHSHRRPWGRRCLRHLRAVRSGWQPREADISAWLVDCVAGVQRRAADASPRWACWGGGGTSGDSARATRSRRSATSSPSTLTPATWRTGTRSSRSVSTTSTPVQQCGRPEPGVAIGYDKYGRKQVGAKVAYAVTPAFTVGAV